MTKSLKATMTTAIEKELEKLPEFNMTIIQSIHEDSANDAVKVARIAQNLYPMLGGFFNLIYNRIVLEEMISNSWVDIEGVQREVQIVDDQEEQAKVVDGVLMLSREFWDDQDIHSTGVKQYLGRYCLGLHVKEGKLANKHDNAIRIRLTAELTTYSDMMNKEFYSFDNQTLRALGMTIVDISTRFILQSSANFCSDEEILKMYDMAFTSIVGSMDTPSDTPFIRGFNTAIANALFLDSRVSDMVRLFNGTRAALEGSEDIDLALPLSFMTRCSTLVQFE